MKHLLTILLTTLTITTALAQDYRWAHGFGGPTGDSQGTSIATDANGNVYVAGTHADTIDFDPGLDTANIAPGGFIAKYDSTGLFQWAVRTAYNSYSTLSIAVNATGVYATGCFNGTFDFDPSPAVVNLTANWADIFLIKFDLNGNFVWVKQMGGTDTDAPNSIAIDDLGNSYITGYFKDTIADFDPGTGIANVIAHGVYNIFCAKYDINGNYQWAFGFGEGTFFNSGGSIAVDLTGIVVSGSFTDTLDFDPNLGTSLLYPTNGGMFLAKYDINGNYSWAFGINASCSSVAIEKTTSNLIITGGFGGTVDFDPGTATANYTASPIGSFYFAKYDMNGNFFVNKQINGISGGSGSKIKKITYDLSGNILLTGGFSGSADFDPGIGIVSLTAAANLTDIFLAKYDNAGNYLEAMSIGGVYSDQSSSIAIDSLGNHYITGFFTNAVDFDPGPGNATLFPATAENIFIAKYSSTLTNVNNLFGSNNADLSIYPNPASDFVGAALPKTPNEILSLQITDVTGRTVVNNSEYNSNKKIDISMLNPGVYILTLKTNTTTLSKLFIKQ